MKAKERFSLLVKLFCETAYNEMDEIFLLSQEDILADVVGYYADDPDERIPATLRVMLFERLYRLHVSLYECIELQSTSYTIKSRSEHYHRLSTFEGEALKIDEFWKNCIEN